MEHIIWCVLLILFMVAEIATPQLTTIWFALGSLIALIVSAFCDIVWVQIIAFLVVSVISILLTRKWAKRFLNAKSQPTNADRYLNSEAVVVEEINNLLGQGQVNAKGAVWSARSEDDGITIPKDTLVTVLRIEGVKMIVRSKED